MTNQEKIELLIDQELDNIRNSCDPADRTARWIRLALENNLVDIDEIYHLRDKDSPAYIVKGTK